MSQSGIEPVIDSPKMYVVHYIRAHSCNANRHTPSLASTIFAILAHAEANASMILVNRHRAIDLIAEEQSDIRAFGDEVDLVAVAKHILEQLQALELVGFF